MLDNFLASSPLPNLHPVLVHFPLALLPLAAGFDLLAIATARRWFDRVAVVLYALGTAIGWWAAEAGEHAADSFVDLPAAIAPEVAEHSDMAHYALYVFAFVLAVRLILVFRDGAVERLRHRGLRLAVLLVAAAGFFFLYETAEHGGALVYRHGLGVAADAVMFDGRQAAEPDIAAASEGPAAAELTMPDPDPAVRLVEGEDRSLTWRPIAQDSRALGTVLFPVKGFARGAAQALRRESGAAGLEFEVLDRTILVFGPDYGDVRVEAELELENFRGLAGVAHHVRSAEAASWFEASTDGGVALRLSQGGSILTLEEAELDAATGSVRIAVDVTNGHHKGMVNGAVVVHGHIDSPDVGKVGLLFDGSGRVVIRRVSVEPIG